MSDPFYRATFTLFRVQGYRDQYDADRERTAEVVDVALTGDTTADVMGQLLEHVDAVYRRHRGPAAATRRRSVFEGLAARIANQSGQAAAYWPGEPTQPPADVDDPGHLVDADDTPALPAQADLDIEPVPKLATGGIIHDSGLRHIDTIGTDEPPPPAVAHNAY